MRRPLHRSLINQTSVRKDRESSYADARDSSVSHTSRAPENRSAVNWV